MASNSSFGKRTAISIETKLEVLEALRQSRSQIDVAKEFGIGYSTVKKIKKNEVEIMKKGCKNINNLQRIRDRKSPNEEVGDALIEWYRQAKARNVSVNGPMMKDKAKELAHNLGYDDFNASHGWLERLKARNNIRFQKPVTKSSTSDSKTGGSKTGGSKIGNVLAKMIEGYDPEDVFNAGESALLYKAAPSILTGNHGLNGLSSKDRLTVLFMCNSTGTEKHAFVIGKVSNPSCFDTAGTPLPYYSSKNAVMTDFIWRDILRKLDRNLKQRKIILFVYKTDCHKISLKLRNIKIVLVPTETSFIQPMDRGIVRMCKIQYRYRLLKKMVFASNRGTNVSEFTKTIDMLKALRMLEKAWSSIPPAMIVDCFQRAGFYADEVYCLDTPPDMSDEANELRSLLQEEFDTFVECDRDIDCFDRIAAVDSETTASPSTSNSKDFSSITPEMRKNIPVEEPEVIIEDANPRVSQEEAMDALLIIRKFLDENLILCNSYYELEEIVRLTAYGSSSADSEMIDSTQSQYDYNF